MATLHSSLTQQTRPLLNSIGFSTSALTRTTISSLMSPLSTLSASDLILPSPEWSPYKKPPPENSCSATPSSIRRSTLVQIRIGLYQLKPQLRNRMLTVYDARPVMESILHSTSTHHRTSTYVPGTGSPASPPPFVASPRTGDLKTKIHNPNHQMRLHSLGILHQLPTTIGLAES